MHSVYDRIGEDYTRHCCADPRIVVKLADVLGISPPANSVGNGAGTGNYSRAIAKLGSQIQALEPSGAMRRQACFHGSVQWSNGIAEQVQLSGNSADVVVCILAAHPFSCLYSAIAETNRVCESGPNVWFTFDLRKAGSVWLRDYFPSTWDLTFSAFSPLEDCFMAAGWRRPEAYLDADARAHISAFALADTEIVNHGARRLASDLLPESGNQPGETF